jgi:hypothetical protein
MVADGLEPSDWLPDDSEAGGRGTVANASDDPQSPAPSSKVPHPAYDGRWADGTAAPGNQLRRRSGVRAFEMHGAVTLSAELRTAVDDFQTQVVADRGGPEELTAIEGGYIRRLTDLETVARLLTNDLATRGLFTPRGRVRSSYGRWLETLDRWDRFAQRVGVGRKPKPIPTLQELFAQIEAEQAPASDDANEPASATDGEARGAEAGGTEERSATANNFDTTRGGCDE